MRSEKTSRPWAVGVECQSMRFLREQHGDKRSGGRRATTREETPRRWLAMLIPPALAVGVYANSLGGDFVHDDLSAITANRDITDPTAGTWDFLYNDFWGTSLLDPSSHKSYRPLTILTFKLNYAVSGLDPWSYHAVNVLLHAVVSVLFAWLCRHCLGLSKRSSLLTASLFAIHPIHTEAVSGIVGRADILSTLFFLLSFICHDRATNLANNSTPPTRFNVLMLRTGSLVSALLSLAAKENGIAALPVAITWDMIRLHQQSASISPFSSSKLAAGRTSRCWTWLRAVVYRSWPILLSFATTVVLLLARISLQQGQLPLFSEQDNPAAFASSRKARILTMLYLPAFNMGLLLAPVLLSYDWQNGSIPLVEDWRDWRNVGTLLFYTTLVAALLYSWLNRKKLILWSAAVMVWPMLPASNLFYPCGFVVAERLLYLPSLGYCLIVAIGLRLVFRSQWARSGCTAVESYAPLRRRSSSSSSSTSSSNSKSQRKLLADCLSVAGVVLMAVTLTTKTWTRNADWADRRTLFESGLRTLPNNAKMHYNYANVQKDDGRWEAAIDHYRQAIELWPNYASALNNLGTVLLAKADELDDGDRRKESTVEEAERRFLDAIRSHPHHAHAHYNLAVLYFQRNETEQSLHLLKRCLHLNPHHREALHLLHWLQSGDGVEVGASGARTIGHYMKATSAEKASKIGPFSTAHSHLTPDGATTQQQPPASHYSWMAANRLQQQQLPQREESRRGGSSNYRWNKTAKN